MVTVEPGGRVFLEGEATGPESINKLATELRSISEMLVFKNIQWHTENEPPSFIASFQVNTGG